MQSIKELFWFAFFVLGIPLKKLMIRFSLIELGNEKYRPIRPADIFVYSVVSGFATLCAFATLAALWVKIGFIFAIIIFSIYVISLLFYVPYFCIAILDAVLNKTLEKMGKDQNTPKRP